MKTRVPRGSLLYGDRKVFVLIGAMDHWQDDLADWDIAADPSLWRFAARHQLARYQSEIARMQLVEALREIKNVGRVKSHKLVARIEREAWRRFSGEVS